MVRIGPPKEGNRPDQVQIYNIATGELRGKRQIARRGQTDINGEVVDTRGMGPAPARTERPRLRDDTN